MTSPPGLASCGGIVPGVLDSVLSLGYDASYAAAPFDLPSTAHGSIIEIGGIRL